MKKSIVVEIAMEGNKTISLQYSSIILGALFLIKKNLILTMHQIKISYNNFMVPFFFCLSLSLYAQQDYIVDIQHFTVEDGLSHREVHSVFEDSRGFVWIGTKYGLNRFDGHNFKIFSSEKNGLANNEVYHIFEDTEGWLWVFSEVKKQKKQFLSFVHTKTCEVKSVEERFGDSFPFDLNNLTGVLSDPQATIYLSSGKGIYKYQNGRFNEIFQSEQYVEIFHFTKTGKILGFFQNSNSEIELFEFDKSLHRFSEKISYLTSAGIKGASDFAGNSWVFIENKSYYKPSNSNNWNTLDLSTLLKTSKYNKHFLASIQYHENNKYWYKDNENLYLFEPNKGILIDFGSQYPELIKSHIHELNFSKNGNVWVCTYFGFFQIRITENSFKNHLNQAIESYETNTAFSTRGLAVSDGVLWANSTYINQYKINLEDNAIRKLELPPIYLANGEIAENRIMRPALSSKNGDIYIASDEIIHFPKEEQPKSYYWKSSAEQNMQWSIFQDINDKIWLGTLEIGLGMVEQDSIVNYSQYNNFNELSSSSVYHFLQWDEAHIFIASTSGIYILNFQNGIIRRFWTGGKDIDFLPYDVIHHFHKDKEVANRLWVATGGGGLIQLTIDSEKLIIQDYQQYTIADGLSNNVLYAVYPDDYDNLWVTSDYGLILFNITSKTAKAYTVLDGLPFNEFNRTAHTQGEGGQLFFGTMNGITSFFPKEILGVQDSFNIPLRITKFNQFNGNTNQLEDRTTDLIQNNKIWLEPTDKFLTLEFALLEFNDAHQIKYSYQLKGLDASWVYLNANELRLSGLPYGRYTLNVRAQGISGQFSSNTLSIPIIVQRPIYLKWWFILIVALVLIYAIYYWNKRRLKDLLIRQEELEQKVKERTAKIQTDKQIIEKQAEKLRSLDEMKSRFFANISHELRTPLTLILGPLNSVLTKGEIDKKSRNTLNIIQNNGQKLNKLVNQILDLGKLDAAKLKLNLSTEILYFLVKRIIASFESIAEREKIELILKFSPPQDLQIKIDVDKFEIVLNNLLFNAIKFTTAHGNVQVTIQKNGKTILLTVSDTGRGIHPDDVPHIFDRYFQTNQSQAPAEGGTGIGLALCHEITNLFGGKIWVTSKLGEGSRFVFEFPVVEVNGRLSDEDEKQLAGFSGQSSDSSGQWAANSDFQPANSKQQLITESRQPTTDNRPTLLLVEDNHDLRAYIRSILEDDYEVIEAQNGKEAIEQLKVNGELLADSESRQPSLIITDLMMPIMDGFQLIEQLKGSDKFRHLPVIVLTARAEIQTKVDTLRVGVDDYILKPFVEMELLARIENLLKHSEGRLGAADSPQQGYSKHQPATNKEQTISAEDLEWLKELEEKLKTKLENSNFKIDDLLPEFGMNRSYFYKKIKRITGLTPNQHLQEIRLHQARQLLETNPQQSIKAIAYSVGFKNRGHFTEIFKNRFGKLPSDYNQE